MGIFDSIRGFLNSEIIATYNDMVNNHTEAFRRWRGKQLVGTFSELFDIRPTYSDKEYVANHKNDILAFEKIIAEEKAFNSRRLQVINASVQYPTAFRALVKKLSIPSIPEVTATLPGERKSNHVIKIEQQAKEKAYSMSSNVGETYFALHTIPFNFEIPESSIDSPFLRSTPKRSINTLKKEEYEKLYSYLGTLPSEEQKLKKELKREDIKISFEDNVLDDEKRKTYYKNFLSENGKKEDDYEYLTEHLIQLDSFIRSYIQLQFNALSKQFPYGVQAFRRHFGESDDNFKERILKNKDAVKKLDIAKRKYNELKQKYPKGLPALERYYSYDDGKNSAELSIEEIVEREEEISLFERYADKYSSFISWQNEQRDFASISRNLNPKDFGCYFYDIPLKGVKPDGTETSGDYRVWQHFYTSFFDTVPEVTIDDDFVYLTENADENSKFLTGGWNYKSSVYDKIWNLIIAYKEKVGDISIVFASNGLDANDTFAFNHVKFEYLFNKFDDFNIPYYEGKGGLIQDVALTKHILIIELVSKNSRLKETVEFIRDKYVSIQPLISYISLRKGYDLAEVEELEAKKEKERQEQKAKEEAEKKRIQQEKERKAAQKRELENCVSNWNCIGYNLHYNYLLRYYPTTCDFDATEDEWADRWLVWNFKNTPGKTSSIQHEQALENLLPRLTRMLNNTFGEKLQLLTLVCIPAASKVNNNARYEDFSKRLTNETDMDNAFDHIQVVKDARPKHVGGTGTPILHFDEDYFKGRYILLFDDVITKGNSMLLFKQKLEALGATVIAGVSVGKTTHERQNQSF